MKKRTVIFLFAFTLIFLISGCRGLGQTPPPPALDPDSMRTAIVLTENAPPPGLEQLAFPVVDEGLDALGGYRYTVEMRFSGTYSQTSRETEGYIQAQVWWDGVGPARRVVLDAEGDAFVSEPRHLEGVRVQDNYYLVDEDDHCLVNVEGSARAIAEFDVGSLIGGLTEAAYSDRQAILNGAQAYRYEVTTQNATLPAIYLLEDTELDVSGELWFAPEQNAVMRFYVNVDVVNARLFESQLPVSGQVIIRYDAYDLGIPQNVSIPFGC